MQGLGFLISPAITAQIDILLAVVATTMVLVWVLPPLSSSWRKISKIVKYSP